MISYKRIRSMLIITLFSYVMIPIEVFAEDSQLDRIEEKIDKLQRDFDILKKDSALPVDKDSDVHGSGFSQGREAFTSSLTGNWLNPSNGDSLIITKYGSMIFNNHEGLQISATSEDGANIVTEGNGKKCLYNVVIPENSKKSIWILQDKERKQCFYGVFERIK